MTTIIDRLAARLDDEFDYDPRVKDAVVAELAEMCRTKKISAAKLKDSIIISCIETHLAALEDADDATPEVTHEGCTRYLPEEEGGAFCETCDQLEDEGTMTDELNAASLEGMREGVNADLAEDDTREEQVEEIIDMLHTAPKFDVEAHNAAVAERDAKEAAAKARRGAHADCDHEATKSARAKCRRERAKAAADKA